MNLVFPLPKGHLPIVAIFSWRMGCSHQWGITRFPGWIQISLNIYQQGLFGLDAYLALVYLVSASVKEKKYSMKVTYV